MKKARAISVATLGGTLAFVAPVAAENFNVPGGTLAAALDAYSAQSGVPVAISAHELDGARTRGVYGEMSADAALTRILSGTGFTVKKVGNSLAIVRGPRERSENAGSGLDNFQLAQAAPSRPAVETVTVTSSKLGGADVQSIPISITALSQEQLTATQTAGGPDLIKQVPNMTFTKTNFSGYSIQLRGIGTQAISVSTDPAVAVAFNDVPFIRNHFFEQEFYDVSQVEVLRGPQGTLYGRNATAGVVNLTSAKPTDQFEAMASGDIGNYKNRRFEAMLNLPLVDDRVDLRVAGEWTKRNGYSFNTLTNSPIDGRDLWSGRVTLGLKPVDKLQIYLIWEHFSENDDRLRSSKQLCKSAPNPVSVNGVPVEGHNDSDSTYDPEYYVSQGCDATSLYSKDALETPNGLSLPYASALGILGPIQRQFNPYSTTTQSLDLRSIESTLNPTYRAKNDTIELNADYAFSPMLTFTSQTGYNHDFLWSAEDYNRFNTAPGIFITYPQGRFRAGVTTPDPSGLGHCIVGNPPDPTAVGFGSCSAILQGAACAPDSPGDENCIPDGVFCDPQLGCSDRLVAEDLSEERAWQLSQEFRLTSSFTGPFNFSVGGNYLHYETEENYYVFINSLTAASAGTTGTDTTSFMPTWAPGVSDNKECLPAGFATVDPFTPHPPGRCIYIDPNPITNLNNQGHNYFLSQNPYLLSSYALFGEAYYNVFSDLKLIAGLRWTEDQKHFVDIPSEILVGGYGYPSTAVVDQQWDQFTGRFTANWTPKLDFTDQTLVYGSYGHGYKAGGANPPGAVLLTFAETDIGNPIHPLTFKPEFIDAFELGTKNTLFDGALTLNISAFYYNYENYQISRIVDRTAINDNFDAHVKGAEVEATWEPTPGLRFNFSGGYEDARAAKGDKSIDLMDRTAGNPDWMVIKPFVTQASNCILPKYVVAALLSDADPQFTPPISWVDNFHQACGLAYEEHVDPALANGYVPSISYPGFDPASAPNNGEGFDKDLSGKWLPNVPPLTISAGAQYTIPLTPDWAGTLRADYYWQDYSWARIFNDNPYDRLRGYTNVNFTLILTSQAGWQVMGYLKNVFNTTAITGDFLNSDDSGLTTNVFLTDPRLFGVRITKNW